MPSFLGQIKRRKVFQVAAVYAVIAWLLVQIASTVEAPLNLPQWFDTAVIVLLAVGFPIALVFSWAFDLTAEGIVRDAGTEPGAAAAEPRGRTLEYMLIGLLIVAVAWLFYRDMRTPEASRTVVPNSVAVLLCDNFSTDPENGFFAASLHEEMLNHLVKLSSLKVVARTSVLQYADADRPPITQIARELNVESVMECSVAYGDGRIVISAQLIDGDTGLHLWSDRYNREFADVFGIQADIAMNVANALQAAFSAEEQASIEKPYTESTAAYALYLQASLRADVSPVQAQALLDRALELDSNFAAAYARKANWAAARLVNTVFGEARTDWLSIDREIRELADKALELDEDLWEAHLALTHSHLVMWRWRESRAALERTLDLNGGNVVDVGNAIWVYSFSGAHEEAVRMARRVLASAPNSSQSHLYLGLAYSFAGDAEAAIPSYEGALRIDATDLVARMYLCVALAVTGRIREAEEQLRLLEELAADSPLPVEDVMAIAYARIGRDDEARRLAAEVLESIESGTQDLGSTALAYLALRDRNAVAERLELAIEKARRNEPDAGFYSLMIIKHDVPADPILNEPRFAELRRRLGETGE